MNNFNQLSYAEAERLALLAEECGEVIQLIGKILRHGYECRHPDGGPTNRQNLEIELGDVRFCMINMCAEGDISKDEIHNNADKKKLKVRKYPHYQEDKRL